MWRRHFHRRHDLRSEGCRLPGKLGIRERLGAQPHRQGELRGDGTDEGLRLGCLWEILFKVLNLSVTSPRAAPGTGGRPPASLDAATAGSGCITAHDYKDLVPSRWAMSRARRKQASASVGALTRLPTEIPPFSR